MLALRAPLISSSDTDDGTPCALSHRMYRQLQADTLTAEILAPSEKDVQGQLRGRVRAFQLLMGRDHGLVLGGRAHTYYAKQLAQQAVMEVTNAPIRANEIDES